MNTKMLAIAITAFFLLGFPGISNAISYSANPASGYYDFGDNPDSYQTTLANNGARHEDGTFEWLGIITPDYEDDGQPSVWSDQDDLTGPVPDDEDGVTFLGTYLDQAGTQLYDPNMYWGGLYGKVDILASVSQWDSGRYNQDDLLYVDAWIDWTHDGDYADSGIMPTGQYAGQNWSEHIISFTTDPSTWGQNSMLFPETFLNGWGPPGPMYARFRLSYDEGVNPSAGFKAWGEVEDYGGDVLKHAQAPIPEPATILLLSAGLAGLVAKSRKRFMAK